MKNKLCIEHALCRSCGLVRSSNHKSLHGQRLLAVMSAKSLVIQWLSFGKNNKILNLVFIAKLPSSSSSSLHQHQRFSLLLAFIPFVLILAFFPCKCLGFPRMKESCTEQSTTSAYNKHVTSLGNY